MASASPSASRDGDVRRVGQAPVAEASGLAESASGEHSHGKSHQKDELATYWTRLGSFVRVLRAGDAGRGYARVFESGVNVSTKLSE